MLMHARARTHILIHSVSRLLLILWLCFCLVSSSHCLRAAAFYIRGLFSFFQGRYNEAKWVMLGRLKYGAEIGWPVNNWLTMIMSSVKLSGTPISIVLCHRIIREQWQEDRPFDLQSCWESGSLLSHSGAGTHLSRDLALPSSHFIPSLALWCSCFIWPLTVQVCKTRKTF